MPYVITTDGYVHFGASHTVVIHPWNLRDGNNTYSVLDKQTVGLTNNAFIIETVDDLTNLNFSANGATGSDGLKGTTTLAQLQASYWTQPCNFAQIKSVDLEGKTWATIGVATTPFTGSYNGQNHSISKLSYTTGTAESGLFGVIKNATSLISC